MHVGWKQVVAALIALPLAALFVAWLGVFNVGASGGHWKITDWFLGFALRSSVRTYALGVEVPDELPRRAIQPAAAHFARGCAICHGAPGEPRNPAMPAMLPQPPDLSTVVADWSDAELFRIVKHGIRFTGMPAWPAPSRDDEVWAMVAFLRALPQMSPGDYRKLAYGEGTPALRPAGIESIVADCARCHGVDGRGRSPVTPIIAGQNEAYLAESLRAYARGSRPSGIMSFPAVAMEPDLISAIARYYSGLEMAGTGLDPDGGMAASAGRIIFENGIGARNIPGCESCHGAVNRNPRYPRIIGQPADYIATQLRLFRAATRGGTNYSHLMTGVARELEDREIAALAAFLSQANAGEE